MTDPSDTQTRRTDAPVDLSAEIGGLWTTTDGPTVWKPPRATPPTAPVHAVAAAGEGPGRRLSFHGSGGSLFGIHIVNVFLTLLTLGVYYPWARVRVRRYLASQSELEGDRFAYHGTGLELLLGILKAALLFAVPFALLNVVPVLALPFVVQMAAMVLAYLIIGVLVPLAMVGARRYRLSRTSWRGIRFSFRGRAREFVNLFIGGAILTMLTFGLYYPAFLTRRQAFMVSHSWLGNERFGFDGRWQHLFVRFLIAAGVGVAGFFGGGVVIGVVMASLRPDPATLWLLVPLMVVPILLSMLLVGLWFQATKQRYFWNHTTFCGARFRSTITTPRLLGLYAVNLLLLVATLGLAASWVTVRNVRFAFRNLELVGPVDLARIQQDAQAATATGEGLAGFLDSGLELDA